MSYASQNVMPFVSELRATGHGELWDHTDEKKFQQFGWRCTNTESSYNTSTLIGNWNEQRFDINRISKPKPIPSQYSHYFETTYGSGYNTVDTSKVPEALKHLEDSVFSMKHCKRLKVNKMSLQSSLSFKSDFLIQDVK
ncbi:UPF0686 protein C11orf1 homolog isoform X2 [Acropora millepora]|uniref:UPF0686 protein C11orf1 homolog isoform X2 n=1 Tax=Acropora millepora TaxID=45264 RepID=UPI001CF10C8E|nr:UPF0686 protein C11orf1 homolog isoform X2 [Acropora millepora]